MKPRQKNVMKGATERGGSGFGDGLAAAARVDYCRRPPRINRPGTFRARGRARGAKNAQALACAAAIARTAAGRASGPNAQRGARADARYRRRARCSIGPRCPVGLAQSRPAFLADVGRNHPRAPDRETRRRRSKSVHQDHARPAVRYFDYATLSLERWPLKAIDFDIVTDGLTSTYRRARQLLPDSWSDAEAEHLHDLRRRVVEHRHQMDLVEPLWPRLGKVWAEEAQRLRNRLGSCQDLAVLTELTTPHQMLAPWRSRLAPLIAARRGAHLKTAQRLAGRLFAEKPKAFRQRIAALVVGAAIKNDRQKWRPF